MKDLIPGLYETLITHSLEERLNHLSDHLVGRDPIPQEFEAEVLAWHVFERLRSALHGTHGEDAYNRRIALVNELLQWLIDRSPAGAVTAADAIPSPGELLFHLIPSAQEGLGEPKAPARPLTSLRESTLLVNGHRELSIGPVLRRELLSADRVDLLCAFLRFTGLNLVRDALQSFFDRGGIMRVITSVYIGATERRAMDALVKMGAQVKVSYEVDQTRLHAKAWLLHRDSGFSTGFVGSSNLSRDALLDGLEWNIRLSAVDNAPILERVQATFEQYWSHEAFEDYDPDSDKDRLDEALSRQRRPRDRAGMEGTTAGIWDLRIELEPKDHQRIILEQLAAERIKGRHRNLVVAATGTGKTWVAAFDYKNLAHRASHLPSLLFVAHREEILRQSLGVYQLVLGRRDFGELLVGGARPIAGHHVFASIQSLHADRIAEIDPQGYEIVVVDEFHHAAAPTYDRLLNHLRPRILLGLTATPERPDGSDVLGWFDGHIASEIRLWQALDQGLLCPFHYFGIYDGTDLSAIVWKRGRYDLEQLQAIYNGNHVRAAQVLRAIADRIADPRRMRALGFCVGVTHARFMADFFSSHDLPAEAITGETDDVTRRSAVARLRSGEVSALFTVDLFNEGVDIPEVDTILFLRPTESATVFLQQLGRGLRRVEGKTVLTVLDFIGNAHRNFRFDARYRAILGGTRRSVSNAIEHDFPILPPGCNIQLDRMASRVVLDNIRQSLLSTRRAGLISDLKALGPEATLADFLRATELELEDVYSRPDPANGWTALRRAAGLEQRPISFRESAWTRAFARMLHVDDSIRLTTWRHWLDQPLPPTIDALDTSQYALLRMLAVLLSDPRQSLAIMIQDLNDLWLSPPMREELAQLLDILLDRTRTLTIPLDSDLPLAVHAAYTRYEVIAALNLVQGERLRQSREGVLWDPDSQTDLLFVTLDKSDAAFSPTTRYADYPLSRDRFHWESQSTTRTNSPTGLRYQAHAARGSYVWLFVRDRRKDERGVGMPFIFLGPVRYESHESERPMRIVWKLEYSMPAALYQAAKVAAG